MVLLQEGPVANWQPAKTTYQGGLAMVYMSNDGNVANVVFVCKYICIRGLFELTCTLKEEYSSLADLWLTSKAVQRNVPTHNTPSRVATARVCNLHRGATCF